MKFVVQNFEVAQKLYQEFRKNLGSVLEKQLTIGRGRADDDISQAFRLRSPDSRERAIDGFHRLRTRRKSEYGGIRLCRIVAIREDNRLVELGSPHGFG